MSYSNSLVWVCSRIGGLKKNLDKVLPLVTFDQISEDKLKNIENHVNGSSKYDQPQVLIADNAIIPRLINETKIPFKFIQGTRVYSDPVLNHIDESSSLSKVPICRFAYPNFAQLVSDNVLKHVRETEQHRYQSNKLQTNIDWINEQIDDPNLLKGLKVGVLGLGKLGKHIAKIFKEQGCETYGLVKNAWSIDPPIEGPYIDHYCVMDKNTSGSERQIINGHSIQIHHGISDLLKECDYICNVLPKTPETDNILGGGKLENCQANSKGAVLINVGRSDIIDEIELIQALDNDWIKEAKIGVFDPEPLAATHPFYSHPNIVLTCIAPVARPLDVANCFKMNYDRFVARHPLLNTINYVSPFNSIQ